VLEPVTTISDYERAVLANADLVAALDHGRAQVESGQGRFAQRRPRSQD
jgi:hypothetical protein